MQPRPAETLKLSERELKLIIDSIPALAWSGRPDGSAEFFNQHFLDYVGLSAEQASDWGWTTAVHPDDREGLVLTWQAIMASEQLGEGEARLRRHDGEYRWFLFRANPVRVRWRLIGTRNRRSTAGHTNRMRYTASLRAPSTEPSSRGRK
jgi:PAS domain S-box-containing protein